MVSVHRLESAGSNMSCRSSSAVSGSPTGHLFRHSVLVSCSAVHSASICCLVSIFLQRRQQVVACLVKGLSVSLESVSSRQQPGLYYTSVGITGIRPNST
jgi:hypothetical protein